MATGLDKLEQSCTWPFYLLVFKPGLDNSFYPVGHMGHYLELGGLVQVLKITDGNATYSKQLVSN